MIQPLSGNLHLHYILEDCETGKYYLDQFKKITEKQFWREDKIKLITNRCDKKTV